MNCAGISIMSTVRYSLTRLDSDEFDIGIQFINLINLHHPDSNCIQVRAPRVKGGQKIGHFERTSILDT